MIVKGAKRGSGDGRGSALRTATENGEGVLVGKRRYAECAQQEEDGLYPIAFLTSKPCDVVDHRLAPCEGGGNRQNGHQIGNVGGIDFDALHGSGGDSVGVAVLLHLCAELSQQGDDGFVSLKGIFPKSRHGEGSLFQSRQCACHQPKGGVGPIALYGEGFGGVIPLSSVKFPPAFRLFGGDSEGGKGFQGEIDIPCALKLSCNHDFGRFLQKWQSKEESADKLRGHATVDGEGACGQIAAHGEGHLAVLGKECAVGDQLLIQGREGAVGESAVTDQHTISA